MAARLFGASEANAERHALSVGPSVEAFMELSVARVRAGIDQATLDAAWASGRALDAQSALSEACGWLASLPDG